MVLLPFCIQSNDDSWYNTIIILCTILYMVMCMFLYKWIVVHVYSLNTVLITVLLPFHTFHGQFSSTKLLQFYIQFLCGSFTILEAPPCEFLLYNREMVEDLINKLDDPDLDCILIMEKAKPTGKGGKPKPPKPKAPDSRGDRRAEEKRGGGKKQ